MVKWLTKNQERSGTESLVQTTVIAALLLAVLVGVWIFFPIGLYSGQSPNDPTGIRASQEKGVSVAAKRSPAPADASTGTKPESLSRTKKILETARPTPELTHVQREAIAGFVFRHPDLRVDDIDYSIAIGAQVPKQAELSQIPTELVGVLPSYKGDLFAVVGQKLLIVEKDTRRIIAVIPITS